MVRVNKMVKVGWVGKMSRMVRMDRVCGSGKVSRMGKLNRIRIRWVGWSAFELREHKLENFKLKFKELKVVIC